MADEPSSPSLPIHEIPYRRLFPWLALFRGPGSAADPKRLMIAALGIVALEVGSTLIDGAFGLRRLAFEHAFDLLTFDILSIERALVGLAEPIARAMTPFVGAFDPSAGALSFLRNACQGLWILLVFGLVGGAICRIAAVDLARRERVGMGEALGFAARKLGSLIGTPLMPLMGVVVVAAPIAGFGLLYRLGAPGSIAAGVLAFLPLIGGLLLTLIVIGLALGWPLMQASVAAEAEDGFDAMSRAYAYVHQRPWHYAAYAALAALIGLAGLVVVALFARLVVALAAWSLAFGAPSDTIRASYALIADGSSPAIVAHRFWLAVVGLLAWGWVYSYFWTAATSIYLLLRRDVDGTPVWAVARREPTASVETPSAASTDPAPGEATPHAAAGLHDRDPGEVADA